MSWLDEAFWFTAAKWAHPLKTALYTPRRACYTGEYPYRTEEDPMLHPIDATTRAAESRLSAFFREHPRAALAFSGGADSAYLLHAARRFGCDVRA